MQSGSPSSASNNSLLDARPLPRRPRRLTFDTGGQASARQTGGGEPDRAAAPSDPPVPTLARSTERRSEPRRPAGPLALAAAVLVLALVSLLMFKQWFVLPEQELPEQVPPEQVQSAQSPSKQAPSAQAPEAGAAQAARMPPVGVEAARTQPAPPVSAATPPAVADRVAPSGATRNGPESNLSGNESPAAQAGFLDPVVAPDVAERPDSQVPASSASPLPADSESRPAAPAGRSRRLADKSSSAEPEQSRPPRPAPAACRGASGLDLAQCRACAGLDVLQRAFCNERTRLAYCAGRYGRTTDCPAPAVAMPN